MKRRNFLGLALGTIGALPFIKAEKFANLIPEKQKPLHVDLAHTPDEGGVCVFLNGLMLIEGEDFTRYDGAVIMKETLSRKDELMIVHEADLGKFYHAIRKNALKARTERMSENYERA